MTVWYTGIAGRLISMTFCARRVSQASIKGRWAYLLEVNFRVCTHASVADEVHDPFFALLGGKVQACGKIAASS
jgi:hypothetical protein